MDYKERFLEIFHREVTREGSQKLLDWLEGTDFFTAPASTRYHCACQFGLVMHRGRTTGRASPSAPCSTTCARHNITRSPPGT